MPGVVGRGKVREAILELPFVEASPEVIPDDALWAAVVCLGFLASIYRYEEQNDGREGRYFPVHSLTTLGIGIAWSSASQVNTSLIDTTDEPEMKVVEHSRVFTYLSRVSPKYCNSV